MDGTFALIDDGVPVAAGAAGARDRVAAAEAAGRPVAIDTDEHAAYLGVSAEERGRRLASLDAPDFRLPDLAGRPHALSDHRGRKVFLVAYGSW